MRRVRAHSPITMFSAVSALADPPTDYAIVSAWKSSGRAIPKVRVNLWDDASANLTGAKVMAGVLRDVTIADDAVDTVDFANNELDLTAHDYDDGDGPVQLTTTDTLPTGLSLATDYFISVVGANTIQLHATFADALAKVNPVPFTDVGVGTHTIEDTAETQRLRWLTVDGAIPASISLSDRDGYTAVFDHHPEAEAYTVFANLSAGNISGDVSAYEEV